VLAAPPRLDARVVHVRRAVLRRRVPDGAEELDLPSGDRAPELLQFVRVARGEDELATISHKLSG
jgi:hypothetical protein